MLRHSTGCPPQGVVWHGDSSIKVGTYSGSQKATCDARGEARGFWVDEAEQPNVACDASRTDFAELLLPLAVLVCTAHCSLSTMPTPSTSH